MYYFLSLYSTDSFFFYSFAMLVLLHMVRIMAHIFIFCLFGDHDGKKTVHINIIKNEMKNLRSK